MLLAMRIVTFRRTSLRWSFLSLWSNEINSCSCVQRNILSFFLIDFDPTTSYLRKIEISWMMIFLIVLAIMIDVEAKLWSEILQYDIGFRQRKGASIKYEYTTLTKICKREEITYELEEESLLEIHIPKDLFWLSVLLKFKESGYH